MNEKTINALSGMAVSAMNLYESLKEFGIGEDTDYQALINIRNKIAGARNLALHFHNQTTKATDEPLKAVIQDLNYHYSSGEGLKRE